MVLHKLKRSVKNRKTKKLQRIIGGGKSQLRASKSLRATKASRATSNKHHFFTTQKPSKPREEEIKSIMKKSKKNTDKLNSIIRGRKTSALAESNAQKAKNRTTRASRRASQKTIMASQKADDDFDIDFSNMKM